MADGRDEGIGLAGDQAVDEHEAGDAREEEVQRDAAGDRGPAEIAGKEDDEQEAPPEDGHRIAGQRDAHGDLVEPRAALDGGEDAGRNAEQHRQHHSEQRQFDRGREQRHELFNDGALGGERDAEIALQDAGDIVEILLPDGQVVAELLLEDFVALGRHAVLAGHREDGIAGEQADKGKGCDRDADDGRHDQSKFLEDEAEHMDVPKGGASIARRPSKPGWIIRSRRRCRSDGCRAGPWCSR